MTQFEVLKVHDIGQELLSELDEDNSIEGMSRAWKKFLCSTQSMVDTGDPSEHYKKGDLDKFIGCAKDIDMGE